MYEFLRKIPFFADLADEDLERVCRMAEEIELAPGEELFAEGSIGDRAFIIREGELEIIKAVGDRQVLVAVRGAGEVIGEIGLIEDAPRGASVRARTATSLITIHQEQFHYLLNTSPSASRSMLHTVLARWRITEAALRQSEKMAQLGTFTAGIAHELNNPAAAVQRGADQLDETLSGHAAAQIMLARLNWTPAQQRDLDDLALQTRQRAARPAPYLAPVARSDREDELETWLDDHGAPDAWELAPLLVNLGYDVAQLAALAERFSAERLTVVVQWLAAIYASHNLLTEIGHAAQRISEIVKALKSYAYLDQAPVQNVDIHEGIDNTLMILRNKLKAIKVQRSYAPDLPKIEAYGSELNQVWTNLLDNAADALATTPGAEIQITTTHDGDWVKVMIADNGPGIPAEHINRIFDAFFTTKPPGKGTGLGLEITYSVVVNRHRGDIKVYSEPGRTCFVVALPLNQRAGNNGDMPRPVVATAPTDFKSS